MVSHAGAWPHAVPKPALVSPPGQAAGSSLPWGSAGSFPNATQLGEKLPPQFFPSFPSSPRGFAEAPASPTLGTREHLCG